MLINKKESLTKLEDILMILSSYLIRLPVDLNSFEWLFTLKYYFDMQTKQIFIRVFRFANPIIFIVCFVFFF